MFAKQENEQRRCKQNVNKAYDCVFTGSSILFIKWIFLYLKKITEPVSNNTVKQDVNRTSTLL